MVGGLLNFYVSLYSTLYYASWQHPFLLPFFSSFCCSSTTSIVSSDSWTPGEWWWYNQGYQSPRDQYKTTLGPDWSLNWMNQSIIVSDPPTKVPLDPGVWGNYSCSAEILWILSNLGHSSSRLAFRNSHILCWQKDLRIIQPNSQRCTQCAGSRKIKQHLGRCAGIEYGLDFAGD